MTIKNMALAWLPTLLLAAVVVWQNGKMSDLEERVAVAETRSPVKVSVAPQAAQGDGKVVVERQVAAATDKAPNLEPLSQRLGALERELARLRLNKANRKVNIGGQREVVKDDVAALREDVDTLLTGGGIDAPEAKEKVEEVVEQAQKQRWQNWRKMRAEAETQWVGEFAKDNDLEPDVQQAITGLLDRRREARSEFYRSVQEDGVSYADARAKMDATRAEVKEDLRSTLGEEGMAKFEAAWRERRERRRGL